LTGAGPDGWPPMAIRLPESCIWARCVLKRESLPGRLEPSTRAIAAVRWLPQASIRRRFSLPDRPRSSRHRTDWRQPCGAPPPSPKTAARIARIMPASENGHITDSLQPADPDTGCATPHALAQPLLDTRAGSFVRPNPSAQHGPRDLSAETRHLSERFCGGAHSEAHRANAAERGPFSRAWDRAFRCRKSPTAAVVRVACRPTWIG